MKKMYIRSIKTTVHPCKNIILSLTFYLLILTCVPQMIAGNDSNLLIVFYVQIMPDDLVMQLHRF
ncbi:TPA: hypothetical protein MI369_10690 [Klebsiella pneumoniae]|nr:hypothetical protein [Klebsiella pneumoniae]